MFKTKLQILCQQRHWPLPLYTSTKDGPDHNPNFSATVTVNGVVFSSVDQSRTSKEAQSNAAKVAFEQITGVVDEVAVPPVVAPAPAPAPVSDSLNNLRIGSSSTQTNGSPSQVRDDNKLIDVPHLYKNRLQNYALKNNIALPVYSCKREGPAHALRFKCSVTFQGRTIECSELCSTIKEAEYAAAKLAWESWSLDEAQQDDSPLYKNLLQEFLQKKGYLAPKYEVKISGPPHMPVFAATIDILGQVYEGPAASSKKQSESLAAKVAYLGLKDQERKDANEINLVNQQPAETQPADSQPGSNSASWIVKTLDLSSSALQSVIATGGDVAPRVESEANAVVPAETSEELTVEEYIASTLEAPTSLPELSQSAKRQCLPPDQAETIVVRPRTPNMTYPSDASVLPFSNNKWVAMKNSN